jgi:hypothetical protein
MSAAYKDINIGDGNARTCDGGLSGEPKAKTPLQSTTPRYYEPRFNPAEVMAHGTSPAGQRKIASCLKNHTNRLAETHTHIKYDENCGTVK